MKARNLTGHVFGRLLVIKRIANDKYGRTSWECLCRCGTTTRIPGYYMTSGDTTSCGCLHREVVAAMGRDTATHGLSFSSTYGSWRSAKDRCYRSAHSAFARYGGRGITMCGRWKNNFEAFLADMGVRPAGKSLDRFPDKDGNYEPTNCRWATAKEQANNRNRREFV